MKRNSKRLVAALLSAGLCAGALSGCGAESTTTAETGTETQTETEQEVIRTTEEPAEAEAEEEWSDVFVEPVAGISDDFIRGMDASAVLSVEKSGAKYYGYDGKEQDVFETLAESGVNYIRLRVWNNPYDENGNGYGGGDNDVATAIELGKRATQYGMKVNIDFHYSDFWADPKRQHAPKAWEGMSADEKADALYDFTKESLTQILDAGVDVGMVQVGNEINNGMSGETDVPAVMGLLSAGSRAVREIADSYGKDIQIVLHYTNIEDNEEVDTMAANLKEYGVDYDIFGLSYYPFWDGTNENMQNVAKNIMDRYGKKVVIAETSYCYTEKDGDGFGNSFDGIEDAVDGYAPTVQSQATMIRDICAAANEVGVLGVFYWEGTWIPVGSEDQDNSALWEKYGSGWASSYSAEYDPDDAGVYYGGCSWDNQAMFDFTGHPLPSLNVFRYLKDGHTVPLAVDFIPQTTVSRDVGEALTLPETVEVVYNDRSANTQVPVSWDASQVAAIDTKKAGTYTVDGTLSDGTAVTADVDVEMVNYVKNPGFEEVDRSMWEISYAGENDPTDYQEKADDAHDGDMESTSDLELYAVINGEEIGSDAFMLTTWTDWKQPKVDNIRIGDGDTLTIGVRMKCNANSWGTIDDFTLNRISDKKREKAGITRAYRLHKQPDKKQITKKITINNGKLHKNNKNIL